MDGSAGAPGAGPREPLATGRHTRPARRVGVRCARPSRPGAIATSLSTHASRREPHGKARGRPITGSRPVSPKLPQAHGGAVRPMPRVGASTGTDRRRRPIHGAAADMPCEVLCSARDRRTGPAAARAARDAPSPRPRTPGPAERWQPRRATSEDARPADDYETRYGTSPVSAGEVIRTRTTLNESAGRVGRPPDAQRCRAGAGCPCRARRLASDRDLLATFGGYRDPETLEPRRRPVPGLRAGRRAGAGRTTPGGLVGDPSR